MQNDEQTGNYEECMSKDKQNFKRNQENEFTNTKDGQASRQTSSQMIEMLTRGRHAEQDNADRQTDKETDQQDIQTDQYAD